MSQLEVIQRGRGMRIRSPVIWFFFFFLSCLIALAIRPGGMGIVHASSGGFTSANIHFTDTGDGYLTATSRVDGSVRSGFSSNHMLVHYFDGTGSEIGRKIIPIVSDFYDRANRTDTITVRYSDVVSNAPEGTLRATLDQCVILLNGTGKGTYFLYDNVPELTTREKMQFDRWNSGEFYLSAAELNQILDKVHRYVSNWNPSDHRYEVFDYYIDLPSTAYSDGASFGQEVELVVRPGVGIGTTFGGGTYHVGDSPVYGGTPLTGYNAPSPTTIQGITESMVVRVDAIPWSHSVYYELNGGSGDFPSFVEKTGSTAYISEGIPLREGYTFAGWRIDRIEGYGEDASGITTGTNATIGTILDAGDRYRYHQNGGFVILVAQWKVNSYELIYHQNAGGVDQTIRSYIQWEDLDGSAIGTTAGVIGRTRGVYEIQDTGFIGPLASSDDGRTQTFTGWDFSPSALKPRQAGNMQSFGVEISRHLNQAGDVSMQSIIRAAEVVDRPGSRIHIYAVWDDVPEFLEIQNLYFTSNEAAAGITQEILKLALTGGDGVQIRIRDVEDGEGFLYMEELAGTSGPSWKKQRSDSVFLSEYDISNFQDLGVVGGRTIRFVAVDWAGNTRTATAMVYVTSSEVLEQKVYVRMIDEENFKKERPESGGLEERSIWKIKDEERQKLQNSL